MQLTRDKSYYDFNPDPCWKTLQFVSPDNVTVANGNVQKDGDSGRVTGALTCSSEYAGKTGSVIIAFYNSDGKMLNLWMQTVGLNAETEFELQGVLTDYSLAKLFVLECDDMIPLCPAKIVQ